MKRQGDLGVTQETQNSGQKLPVGFTREQNVTWEMSVTGLCCHLRICNWVSKMTQKIKCPYVLTRVTTIRARPLLRLNRRQTVLLRCYLFIEQSELKDM